MKASDLDKKFDEIVDFSGVEDFIDTPAKRYSSGMTVRLAFAVAAHLEPLHHARAGARALPLVREHGAVVVVGEPLEVGAEEVDDGWYL